MIGRWRMGVVLLPFLGSACASHMFLTQKDQEKIQAQHTRQAYYLKYSNFVGPFFAYDDRLFISERAFDERALIESPGGDPILPAEPTAILPMGTKVRVRAIEFPTGSAIAARKLKSPRHFTWVLLGLEDGSGKPFVLVLTQEFRKVEDFDSALRSYLVATDPRPAFAGLSPQEQNAIDRKSLVQGMGVDALFRSRGHPDRIARETVEGAKMERWQYGSDREVILRNNRVESWKGFPELELELLGRTPKDATVDQPDSSPKKAVPPPGEGS